MKSIKLRNHNEWFQNLTKTSCPCGNKKVHVLAWGEYHHGKWRTIEHFCAGCFQDRVLTRLIAHAGECGCTFTLQARVGHSLPDWLKMPEQKAA